MPKAPPDPAWLDLALTLAGASGHAFPPHRSTCEETGQMIDRVSTQGIAVVDVELAERQTIGNEPNERILDAIFGLSRA
jgi:hypothetical protein